MELDKSYEGREHSAIKHELLKGYLEQLLYIVGVSGVKEITYVDCFAGPWGDESDDLHGTSPAISLDIIKRVHEGLAANNKIYDIKFRAIYVEETKKRHAKLCNYLDNSCPSYIEHYALHGDYSQLQDEILSRCGDGFTFFFIDPKGWTHVGIQRLSKLLRRQNSEFLITFMYDFLNRFLTKELLHEQVSQLLGEIDEVKEFWLAHLSSQPESYSESDLADWLEETGWLEYDFQQAFNSLRIEQQVENLDDTSNRRSKWYVHFDKNERLRKLI